MKNFKVTTMVCLDKKGEQIQKAVITLVGQSVNVEFPNKSKFNNVYEDFFETLDEAMNACRTFCYPGYWSNEIYSNKLRISLNYTGNEIQLVNDVIKKILPQLKIVSCEPKKDIVCWDGNGNPIPFNQYLVEYRNTLFNFTEDRKVTNEEKLRREFARRIACMTL